MPRTSATTRSAPSPTPSCVRPVCFVHQRSISTSASSRRRSTMSSVARAVCPVFGVLVVVIEWHNVARGVALRSTGVPHCDRSATGDPCPRRFRNVRRGYDRSRDARRLPFLVWRPAKQIVSASSQSGSASTAVQPCGDRRTRSWLRLPLERASELVQLALPPHDRHLGPVLVVHRVDRQHESDAVGGRLELDRRRDVVRLDTGDEVRDLREHQTRGRDDLDVPAAIFGRHRHAGVLHELDLIGSDGRHRVPELPARPQIQRVHLHRETIGAPPRLEALLRRPHVPDPFDVRVEGPLDGDLPRRFFGHPRVHHCRYARSSVAMSSLPILSTASMTLAGLPAFGSPIILPRTVGTTCHETPKRSFSQPHGPGSPPSCVSLLQMVSISSWVSQVATNENASVNENEGPPSKAVYSWPSSVKVACSTLPFGIGPPSLRSISVTFEFLITET